jgi:hypothetical protein
VRWRPTRTGLFDAACAKAVSKRKPKQPIFNGMDLIKDAKLLKFKSYQQYLRALITPTLEKYFDSDIFIAKMFEAGVG